MLTGGEPMLRPTFVINTMAMLRIASDARLIVYTAKVDETGQACDVLDVADGITVTLHEQKDVEPFLRFANQVAKYPSLRIDKNLRLNIFAGVYVPAGLISGWVIKYNIEWIKDCPLPANETFARLNHHEYDHE